MNFNNPWIKGDFNGGLLGGPSMGGGMMNGMFGGFTPMQRPQMGQMGGLLGGAFQRTPYQPQRFPAPNFMAPQQAPQQAPAAPAPTPAPQQSFFYGQTPSPTEFPQDVWDRLMEIQRRGGA